MPVEFTNPSKSIADIYYLANTPSYLYNMMRQDPYVLGLSIYESRKLIDEFNNRANIELNTVPEMAFMYAILIALTFKPPIETKDFFKHIQDTISFEWFSDIVTIFYNTTQRPTIINFYDVKPNISTLTI